MKIENCTVVFKLFPSKSQKKIPHEQYLAIARNGWNVEYRPKKFHAIIMRFLVRNVAVERGGRKCKIVAALIFKSGKVVLTGVPEPALAEWAARKVSQNVRIGARRGGKSFELGSGLIYDMRVVNVVAAHQMSHRISIERIHALCRVVKQRRRVDDDGRMALIASTQYEHTIFPALRCKISTGPTALVYISGKVILTGLSEASDIPQIFQHFIAFLSQFSR